MQSFEMYMLKAKTDSSNTFTNTWNNSRLPENRHNKFVMTVIGNGYQSPAPRPRRGSW